MVENKKGLFIIFAILLLIVNLELVKAVFSFSGELFVFELLLLVFFGIMALDSMNEFSKSNFSCFSVLAVFFGVNLLNSVCLSFFAGSGRNISLLLFAGIGFLLSAANMRSRKSRGSRSVSCKKDSFDGTKKPEIDIADYDTSNLGGGAIMTEYDPGKYLASKTGKKYHSPRCDFAKKIPKRNQVWFNSKDDAKKKGYGPCKCI